MGFALFAFSSLYQPLRRIAVSMRARPAHHGLPGAARATYQAGTQASNDPLCAAINRHAARQAVAASPAHPTLVAAGPAADAVAVRPLRVILNRQEGETCRLVISGRMADVCAELNRLALH